MILYHGSNTSIDEIDLEKCRPNKDFGQGFYTTSIFDQALKMARRVAKRFGGTPCVTSFQFDENILSSSDLSIKRFITPDVNWAMFVMHNRSGGINPNSEYTDNNLDGRYDIVIGPVANDDLSLIFRLFERGIISLDMLISEMKFRDMTNQYSFHSQRAASLLKRIN
ncbi:MAG: DUF3990 domain-containing protein [Victivallales bacterium]|nr:DUF3990 domain-containing protein [Victivallales bacterium]